MPYIWLLDINNFDNKLFHNFLTSVFIYLFIRQIPNPAAAGSTLTNTKEREKKEREVRRVKKKEREVRRVKKKIKGRRTKPPTPTQSIDVHRRR